MAVLSSVYITTEKLKELLSILNQKQAKGVDLTISMSNEQNNYGQNLSVFVSQSKEDRDAKKPKYYVGNGKVFWTDGTVKVAEKVEGQSPTQEKKEDDLPF
jgi:hypothetical protein